MSLTKWILPVICATGTLCAQASGDLNGLVLAASHYISFGMGAPKGNARLELVKINGDSGGNADLLLTRSAEVVHWTLLYRVDASAGVDESRLPVPPAIPLPHRSLTVQCSRGVFGEFKYSPEPITNLKPLDDTWIAVNLGEAISQLNANGYVQGFTKVTLFRPEIPGVPSEYVYLFDCPLERTKVAISTQSGAVTWFERY